MSAGPTPKQRRAMLLWERNRGEFIPRLKIKAKEQKGRLVRFDRPTPGQVQLSRILADPTMTELVLLKARQVHFSTMICAHVFHDTWIRQSPLRTLVACNHTETTDAIFEKYQHFYQGLPSYLKKLHPFKLNLTKKWVTALASGAAIDHLTAGGSGGGRGWNYQRFIAEECAFWPNATKQWAAITSAVDDDAQVILVSTPNGPGNLYHRKCIRARDDQNKGVPGVRFLFLPWYEHPKYSRVVPDGWEPTHEEYVLQRELGLSDEQLYWRHWRIHGVKGIGEADFLREYPATFAEGFLVMDGSWYNVDYLNTQLTKCADNPPLVHVKGVRIYRKREAGMRYAAGVDPSWCNGGDNAVLVIIDENGRTACVFSMNHGGEQLFAEEAADLIHAYGAKVLTEGNKGGAGKNVLRYFEECGLTLWKHPETGKDWTTGQGNKQEAFSHHRRMVNGDAFDLSDEQLIEELMHVREVNNKLEGQDGYNDDHAMAHVLAEKCRQSLPGGKVVIRDQPREYTRNPLSAINRAIG